MAATSGRKIVATPGTPERLVTRPTFCRNIRVFAIGSNTTVVYVGDRHVCAVNGSTQGDPLHVTGGRGDFITLSNVDLSDVWVDARTADEGVEWGPSYE